MINSQTETCPRCHAREFKTWNELSADEKIAAAKMPLSSEFSLAERKRHRFCVRCWFEQTGFETSDFRA